MTFLRTIIRMRKGGAVGGMSAHLANKSCGSDPVNRHATHRIPRVLRRVVEHRWPVAVTRWAIGGRALIAAAGRMPPAVVGRVGNFAPGRWILPFADATNILHPKGFATLRWAAFLR